MVDLEDKGAEVDDMDISIIEALNRMNDKAFQRLVTKLMNSMGLEIINSEFRDKKAKIEAKIGKRITEADFPWYLITVERKKERITPEEVQEFVSERKSNESGMIYMSTSSFSSDARQYAREFDVEITEQAAFAALLRKFDLLDEVMIYRDKEILKEEKGRFLPSIDELESIVNLGKKAYSSGRLKEALRHFIQAAEMKPKYDDAWYMKGVILNDQGDYEGALEAFMQALEINIDNAKVWFSMGIALFSLGRYDEEIQCYDKAIELKKDFLSAWNNKGATLLHLERFEEANETYDEILKMNSNFKLAWNNKGISLKKLDRIEEAQECFTNAIKLDSRYLDAWMNRGLIYFKEKRYKNAYHCFTAALKINENHIQALYYKAKTFEGIGQYSSAIEIYEEIMVLNPKFYPAKRRKKKALIYLEEKGDSTLDDDFLVLNNEEAKEYHVDLPPSSEKKILVEKKVAEAREPEIHYTHIPHEDEDEHPKEISEPQEITTKFDSLPIESSQETLEPVKKAIPKTIKTKELSETEDIKKMKAELKEKERDLIQMEAWFRERYFTLENERKELKNIRSSLERKKEELDNEKQKAQNIAYDVKSKSDDITRSEEDLRRAKEKLIEEQVEIERERVELNIRAKRMALESSGSSEDRIALERDIVRLDIREKEISAAKLALAEERENIESERMALRKETEKVISAQAELAARDKSINQREEEIKIKFDQIVDKSGDMAIKEKELEEMAVELKRTQDNLEKKAKMLKENEMELLKKQKLLAENRGRMKGAVPGIPYTREGGGKSRRRKMEMGFRPRGGPDIKGTELSRPQLAVPPSLSTTLDHERIEREFIKGEMESLSDIMAMYSTNQLDLVQKRIDEAQAEGLDSKLIWNIKGNIMRKKKEYEKALECYNKALKRDQNYVITLVNMMSLFYEMVRYQEALELSKKIQSLRPYDEKFILTRALLEARCGQTDEAISTIDGLLVDNDKLDMIWNLKGILLYNMNQNEDAQECFEEALKLNPENTLALNNKGAVLYKIEKYNEALDCFNQVQKIQPNQKTLHNIELTSQKGEEPIKDKETKKVKKPKKKAEEPSEVMEEPKEVEEPEIKVEQPPEVMEEPKEVEEPEMEVEEPPEVIEEPKEVEEPEIKVEQPPEVLEEPKEVEEPEIKVEQPPEVLEEPKEVEEPEMEEGKESMAEILGELGKISDAQKDEQEPLDDVQDEISEVSQEIEEKEEEGSADLYMCPSCGSFVSPSATICEQCGYDFEEEEELEEEEQLGEPESEVIEQIVEAEVKEPEKIEKDKDIPKKEKKIKKPSKNEVIEKFTQISGVGASKAETLYKAGYTSYKLLRKSKISDLGNVKGIGKNLAKNIKDQLKKKKFKD
jgi:tetratricopeptide (TPR) repeat protein